MSSVCHLSFLPPDAFECIVKEVAKRLRPSNVSLKGTDTRLLCDDFLQACRELRVLAMVPNQKLHPEHDPSDRDGAVWKDGHALFGAKSYQEPHDAWKQPNVSWKANFKFLYHAFDFDLTYEVLEGSPVGDHRTECGWVKREVWRELWLCLPDQRQRATDWMWTRLQEEHSAELRANGVSYFDDVDYESFDEWLDRQDARGMYNLRDYHIVDADIFTLQWSLINLRQGLSEGWVERDTILHVRSRVRLMMFEADKPSWRSHAHTRAVFKSPKQVAWFNSVLTSLYVLLSGQLRPGPA